MSGQLIMFVILAVVIIASAVMSIMTTRIMRAATYLLFVLFGVAGIYFLLEYTFLGAAQIAVYCGGIIMIYIFAIQLVSKRVLQGLVERMSGSRVVIGALVALIGVITVVSVFLKNSFISLAINDGTASELNTKVIGEALIGADKYQYVLPFEFISVFLLACIIGGILISRKD